MKCQFLLLLLLGLMIEIRSQNFKIYPRVREQNRIYHASTKPRVQRTRHQMLSSNNNIQRDAISLPYHKPSTFTRNRNGNHIIQRTDSVITQPLTNHRIRNNADYNVHNMSPSYTRNGNHHLITIPIPRNTYTRITVPLKNVNFANGRNHRLSSRPVAPQIHHPFIQNYAHSSNHYIHPYSFNPSSQIYSSNLNYPHHSTRVHPVPKPHHVIVHIGTQRYPSLPETYLPPPPPPKVSYNYYPQNTPSKVSFNNGAHKDYKNQFYNNNNFYTPNRLSSQNRKLNNYPSSLYNTSNIPPHVVISSPTYYEPKTYDQRSSLGTSALKRKPTVPHNIRTNIKISKLNDPSIRYKNSIIKSDLEKSSNLPTKPMYIQDNGKTMIHVKVRPPQKFYRNSSKSNNPTKSPAIIKPTDASKSFPVLSWSDLPSNCIRCPTDQTLIIEKGKSCVTVTIPPIKACSRLTKRPGKMDVLLGLGPKPGSIVKEGSYMMQFHILKAGAKVQTCQFKLNVKALKCPAIQKPRNSIFKCTNNEYWGSTCNFVCNDGYTLVGKSSVSCEGNKKRINWTSSIPTCESITLKCPSIKKPTNGIFKCTNNEFWGSICSFDCDKGYMLVGESSVSCNGNKKHVNWSSPIPTCEALKCPPIKIPTNGIFQCTNNEFWGSICNFDCDEGYTLVGESPILCIGNKKHVNWSSSIPICEPLKCPPIKTPINGIFQCTNNEFWGSTCNFDCDKGYILAGESTISCIGNKKYVNWSSSIPICESLKCPPIKTPTNGIFQCTNNEFWGSICNFDCDEGYTLVGESPILCTGNKKHVNWSSSIPICESLKCPPIKTLTNGIFECSNNEFWGSICKFDCDKGYSLAGESTISCKGNKNHVNWSSSIPVCEELKCPPINTPTNGIFQCTDNEFWGSICNFDCNEGYILVGESPILCIGNKKHVNWSSSIPICESLKCPSIKIPRNGIFQCTNNEFWGSICSFDCDKGYTLVGESSISCEGNKTHVNWTTSAPTCEKIQTSGFNSQQCQKPEDPKNGFMYCEPTGDQQYFSPGSVCQYFCNPGFEIPSSLIQYGHIICIGQKWNISHHIDCQPIQCSKPDEPLHGYLKCNDTISEWSERGDTSVTNQPNYPNGTKCYFNCNANYVIPTSHLDRTVIECIAPYWNNSDFPQCIEKVYPVHHSDDCKNQTLLAKTETVEITPPRFIAADGNILISQCSLNKDLKPGLYDNFCEAEDPELRIFSNCSYTINIKTAECKKPPVIKFGTLECTVSDGSYPVNTECQYNCMSGYVIPMSMKHLETRICLPSSVWNETKLPECKKRIVPEPEKDACIDLEFETDNPSSIILKNPVFLTAEGKPAEVSCTLSHILHHGTHENFCKAMDPELQTYTSCKYTITIKEIGQTDSSKGHECGALQAPTNGYIECQIKDAKFHCAVKCKIGYSFPSAFKLLHRGFVECDPTDGFWDFQTSHGLANIPDCLAKLPSTSLQAPLMFKAGIENCSDYIALDKIMTAIKENLLTRTISYCHEVDCTDMNYMCGEDKERKKLAIETIWTLKATYNVEDYKNNENIPDAETNIEEIQAKTNRIIVSDETFKDELHRVGADLWQDSFNQGSFELVCPISGYVVDPDTEKCFECPSGTYEEDGRCKICPGNHYQDQTGQIMCKPCPRGTISSAGSRTKSSCKVLEESSNLVLPQPVREQSFTGSSYNTICDSNPCQHGGTCILTQNSFKCLCKENYRGSNCESVNCPENFCLNGGTCTSLQNSIVGCACPKFYSGIRCEIRTGKSLPSHVT